MLNRIIKFFLKQKLLTVLLLLALVGWGLVTAPFNWNIGILPRDPVPVDAIPDIGENQQIVFTEWMGRSPQDVEDQITYPLTTALLGMPGVKTIRSTSMFGFSSIYIIFDDEVDYYWSRSRILEKLSALPSGLLPQDVQPKLGPDATALGQVYWYTLEGRDENGNPAGGWDLHELRTIQDFQVRYALAAVEGVAEVASAGGHIKEYQVDLDPVAMKTYNISMMEVMQALRNSNRDAGANTVEINQVEYLIRGLGYIKNIEDIEQAVVRVNQNVPVRITDIARVTLGPADRAMLGILDKSGAEAAGGVVIARQGGNPLAIINKVKDRIREISPGLPSKKLDNGKTSKVTIVPFYDRTHLIYETLGTLNNAITLQILITILVILVMVYNLRASLLISALLPMAVLTCFIFMKYTHVDANIVALSGIAIAIGTMVDLGIILNENILKHLEEAPKEQPLLTTVYNAVSEVSSAIITAVSTTIVSFLPVFTLQAAEGKLFSPLAYTKTFALVAALIFTLIIMPAFSHWVFGLKVGKGKFKIVGNILLALAGLFIAIAYFPWAGVVLILFSANNLLHHYYPHKYSRYHEPVTVAISVTAVSWVLASVWLPLGVHNSIILNFLFILVIIGLVLAGFRIFIRFYPTLLNWCLENKIKFLLIPLVIVLFALNILFGFDKVFGFVGKAFDATGYTLRTTPFWSSLSTTFPGMSKEFMPSLNEGAFLLMPTSMPHAGVEANKRVLQQLDRLVAAIPEVEMVVGKAGRAETALDPAPMSMYENVILYKPEYITDENGRKLRFKTDAQGRYKIDISGYLDIDGYSIDTFGYFDRATQKIYNSNNQEISININQYQSISKNIRYYLIEDKNGEYYRQWRDEIKSPDDIWAAIVNVAKIPGVTSAPKLQPIETRLVMLQTGMRAPMGLKVYGPDLKTIESFSLELEKHLKEVPSIKPEAVYADRALGKPYMEIVLNRKAMARYGLNVNDVQEYIEVALGGMNMTTTVEGRERYSIRARYAREWRSDPYTIGSVFIATPSGAQIPLREIADITYRPGPMMIRSEDSFLVGYVLLDKKEGYSEVSVVEEAQRLLHQKTASGELVVPAGVSYKFSGSYENQIRAEKRLAIVIPLSLMIIFLILYFQFRSVTTSLFIFSAIAMAFAGGFMMLWLYGQNWFLDFTLFGTNFRELFQVRAFNLSVAVWVGFIALFGIATDDGVVIGTYLTQSLQKHKPTSAEAVRKAVLEAGMRRLRPCLMTTATTLLALLPVLTSSGRGSDIMIPMAIPAFGGMAVALITLFIVPVLYSWKEEITFRY